MVKVRSFSKPGVPSALSAPYVTSYSPSSFGYPTIVRVAASNRRPESRTSVFTGGNIVASRLPGVLVSECVDDRQHATSEHTRKLHVHQCADFRCYVIEPISGNCGVAGRTGKPNCSRSRVPPSCRRASRSVARRGVHQRRHHRLLAGALFHTLKDAPSEGHCHQGVAGQAGLGGTSNERRRCGRHDRVPGHREGAAQWLACHHRAPLGSRHPPIRRLRRSVPAYPVNNSVTPLTPSSRLPAERQPDQPPT